jgi:hypothetical protein
MRSRCTLHKSKLAEFQNFCEANGWQPEHHKGAYEVLRMRHADRRDPLIVHSRLEAKEHYTTWGESSRMLARFIRSKKVKS